MPVTNPFRAAAFAAILTAVALLATSATASAAACPGAGSQKLSKADAGRAIFCLVNRERTQRGLPALGDDGRLAKVARVHARDMVRYRFISHTSPARGGLAKRVRRSGFAGRGGFSAGEILAAGFGRYSTPRWVVRAWMRRPVHRKAILFRSFSAMGVGIARGMPARRNRGRSFVITFAG